MAGDVCEVTIIAPDSGWITEFISALVADRLCSAGHQSEVRSLYRWHGEVHDRTEFKATLRTRRSLVPQIVKRAHDEHPYELPSIVAVPIVDGNPDYLRWIRDETVTP